MVNRKTIHSHLGLKIPSPWVARFSPLIPRGAWVLDLAAGGGRHCEHLTNLGLKVTAIDRDTSFIDPKFATEIICHDLESNSPWPLQGRKFAGIIVTNYLHRPLFPFLINALEEGGVIIYETFAQGNEAFSQPRNPDHLLKNAELLQAFADLQIIAYEQGKIYTPKESVVQRICAVSRLTFSPFSLYPSGND